MIFAQKFEKENISEYILYMYQIEDIIKANNLSIQLIEKNVISKFDLEKNEKLKIKNWYDSIIKEMKSSYYQNNKNLNKTIFYINKLNYLNLTLLADPENKEYKKMYDECDQSIKDFKRKLDYPHHNDIHIIFKALYFNILLNLKKIRINPDTKTSLNSFRNLVKMLLKAYYQ